MIVSRRGLVKLAGVSSLAAAFQFARSAEALATSPVPLPFALSTPVHVEAAALKVRDLDAMSTYYQQVLGLVVLSRDGDRVTLGAGGTALLHLERRPGAALEAPSAAGLFHIAYLMPTRQDLARWLVHAAMIQVPVDGFADHHVSEAIYLTDPEGNGIEVYSDRPKERWEWRDGLVTMGTAELDIDSIASLADRTRDTYSQAPDALRIGHIHLRVGDVATARHFYGTLIGLDSTRGNRPDAAFLSSGGYHHHVAVNSWNSRGAERRNPAQTGLDWFSLTVTDKAVFDAQTERLKAAGIGKREASTYSVEDPWGTGIRLIGSA